MDHFTKIWKKKSKDVKKEDLLQKIGRLCPECGGGSHHEIRPLWKIHRLYEISRVQIYGKNGRRKKGRRGKQRRGVREMRRADGSEAGPIRRVLGLQQISGVQNHQIDRQKKQA